MKKRLWSAGREDDREWKKAMESRERISQRVEKRLCKAGRGFNREWKKGYGQHGEEMTEEKKLWKASRGDNR